MVSYEVGVKFVAAGFVRTNARVLSCTADLETPSIFVLAELSIDARPLIPWR